MSRSLDVYLHSHRVGQLTQDDHGNIRFQYDRAWLDAKDATPLSQSIPLKEHAFTRNECRPFFGGVLPEELPRELVARNLGISSKNDFAMLEQIGGECAGAVTLLPTGQVMPDRETRYRELTDKELAADLRKLATRPLLAGEDGVRLSLAGAQNKIVLRHAHGVFSLPLESSPSTHILKPDSPHYPGLIDNEAACMSLARQLGIPVPKLEVRIVEDVRFLLIERYDRVQTRTGHIQRLHQEDFCQALGIVSDRKYQSEGGPSLKDCFHLLRGVSSSPAVDLQRLLNVAIFNLLIGNNDAHGKNFSLLYQQGLKERPETRLAPFYDLVSTAVYPDLSQKLAMKIGGENTFERIFPRHLTTLAEEAGFAKKLVLERFGELLQRLLKLVSRPASENTVENAVAGVVAERCEFMLRRLGHGM